MYRDFFENEDFFPSVLAFLPQVNGVFGAPNTQVFENGPQSGFFFQKCHLLVFVWTETKVFKYDDVIHHRAHAL